MKPLVIYHANCWDGFCAAWVARKALGDIEAVPAQYGQSPPDVKDRVVYVLDFSYSREVMERIATDARRTVMLDHHKTAMDALDGLHQPESGIDVWFDMTKSGGRLAWEWFVSQGYDMPTPNQPRAPWLVDYTEDRDLWLHALEGTKEINAALRSYPLDFELWDQFEQKDPRSTYYYEGAAIRRAERAIVENHVRNAKETDMDGHRVLTVNATVLFSEIAGELSKGRPFGACYFDRQDGKRQWSLRSDINGVDVSAIAKAHGGGGHAHAAGYEILPPLGATGQFPYGKADQTDEGELTMAVAAAHGQGIVRVEFGKPIAWLGLPSQQARAFGSMLIEKAKELDRRKS